MPLHVYNMFLDICFKPNIAYGGIELKMEEKTSAQECQEFCLSTTTCIGFTWALIDKKCSLKSEITNQTDTVNVISGPPSCGKHILTQ